MRPRLVVLLLFCLAAAGCNSKKKDSQKGPQTKSNGGSSDASGSQEGAGKPDGQEKGGAQPSDQVKIPAADQQRAGIQIAVVEVRTVPRTLSVAGQVQMDEQHTSHLGVLADGRIIVVNVLAGAVVHRGQTLATLHSHTVHETVGALAQAYAAAERQRGALTFAQQARDRYAHLYSIQAASLEESQRAEQEVQQVRNMLTDAEANVRMEREHLSELLQVAPESITPRNLYDRELVPIRAVAEGTVVARNITVGQVVDTGFEAFTITNLAAVWVSAAVNERDLPLVRPGSAVGITTQGYEHQLFPGRVTMIGTTLDAETRTVPVRITVANPGTKLRPGMFTTAQIAEPATRDAVFVPEEAMQEVNGLQVVFTTGDGSTFKAQSVTLGTRSGGRAEIVQGLKPGDRIVTTGAFMVKAEMLKGTMGDS